MLHNIIINLKNIRKFKRWDEDMIDLFSISFEPPVDFSYRTVKVLKEHVARPDLVSKYVYGDTQYGDVICRLNGIPNPFELNEGETLVVPDRKDLVNFFKTPEDYEVLEEKSSADKSLETTPSYKKPKEKRKPNEAVFGDSRFHIDKTNRVIIY